VVSHFRQDLSDSRFDQCDLARSRFHNSYFTDAKLSGVWLERVDISGVLIDVTVNGVDIGPLVEAELDRRHPERALLSPTDPAGFAESWTMIEGLWAGTVERARRLPEAALHERVDLEYCFLETLRHLIFATDAWIGRMVLGERQPLSPIGVAHDENDIELPLDPTADPDLDEVLVVRAERMAKVRSVIESVTTEELDEVRRPEDDDGYPPSDAVRPVGECLRTILREEWHHHQFAVRDLAVLETAPDMQP
jgi:hypothetical protein